MIKKSLNAITIVVAICMTMFAGCNNMKFNNSTNKNDLITEEYSIMQVEELKNSVGTEQITFSEFKKEFDVQCVRKTHQGYYVVLLLENNKNAFAFFSDESKLTRIIITDGFMSEKEFQIQALEKKSKSDVLNFDPNTILIPVSAVEMTAHIVQEGICIIKYTRFLDGKVISDPIVSSIEFIDNKSIPMIEDDLVKYEIPFIFGFDKES